jgi:general stress protein 26
MDKEQQKKQALDFLKSKVVAVIATVSSENTPEAATIHYVVDDDFTFYFRTETNSRKAQNFMANNHVALVVGTEDIPVTVQIEGIVQQIDNGEEFMTKYQQLQSAAHSGSYPPILEGLKDRPGATFYKIIPTWVRWTDFREPSEEMRSPVILIP